MPNTLAAPIVHVSQDADDYQPVTLERCPIEWAAQGRLFYKERGLFCLITAVTKSENLWLVTLDGDVEGVAPVYAVEIYDDLHVFRSSIPYVGMGATQFVGSDRYPYTVIEVTDRDHVVVQRDQYKRTDSNGLSESQEYEYTSDPQGQTHSIVYKDHYWRERKHRDNVFQVGSRRAYRDPSY